MAKDNKDFEWFWTKLDTYLEHEDLKQTKQRRAIVSRFLSLDTHVDAERLHKEMRKDGFKIGLATIYRTLSLLKSAGLVEQQTFSDGRMLYEVVSPHAHHDHLICRSCDVVIEFYNERVEQIQKEIANEFGFELVDHRMDLFGYCPKCKLLRSM